MGGYLLKQSMFSISFHPPFFRYFPLPCLQFRWSCDEYSDIALRLPVFPLCIPCLCIPSSCVDWFRETCPSLCVCVCCLFGLWLGRIPVGRVVDAHTQYFHSLILNTGRHSNQLPPAVLTEERHNQTSPSIYPTSITSTTTSTATTTVFYHLKVYRLLPQITCL